jgi:hypothetical protein
MVLFDQLRISDDGKRMYINIHVNKADYFRDIYLDSITIMTADKVSETDPGMPTSDYIYTYTFENGVKEADMVLTASDFTKMWQEDPKAMVFPEAEMQRTLFFVYVKIKGIPDECTPCRLDEEITLGVTFDENILYQKVMQFTKGLTKECQLPLGFSDFILLWNAFKASIETEDYIPAIKFWNMLFDNIGPNRATKSCGCHG